MFTTASLGFVPPGGYQFNFSHLAAGSDHHSCIVGRQTRITMYIARYVGVWLGQSFITYNWCYTQTRRHWRIPVLFPTPHVAVVSQGPGPSSSATMLTHWGRVTHICVGNITITGSDNGLSPHRRQAIIWTNAGVLLIGHIGTNFSEISTEILTFSVKKMLLKASSAKWRPFCLGLNVLMIKHSKVVLVFDEEGFQQHSLLRNDEQSEFNISFIIPKKYVTTSVHEKWPEVRKLLLFLLLLFSRPEVRKLLPFYVFYFYSTWSKKIIPYLRFYFFSTWSWKIITYFEGVVQYCSNSSELAIHWSYCSLALRHRNME